MRMPGRRARCSSSPPSFPSPSIAGARGARRVAYALAVLLLVTIILCARASDVRERDGGGWMPSRANLSHAKSGVKWHSAQMVHAVRRGVLEVFSWSVYRSGADEYGGLTFTATCAEGDGKGTFPVNRDRFESLAQLCDAMGELEDGFRVYTVGLSPFAQLRYALLSWAPTFNRGYDVERQLVRWFANGPFSTRNPKHATAFFMPVMPYLDRVSGFPGDGRRNMRYSFNAFVHSQEGTRLWSKTACKRFTTVVHDYGTSIAMDQPEVLRTTTFISSNAETMGRSDIAVEMGEALDGNGPYSPKKDVSSVCSSSFYLPAKAIEYDVFGRYPRFRRTTLLSFQGGMSSDVRRRVAELVSNERDPSIDVTFDGHVEPSSYMRNLASSKFCLHMKGTRVVSPRLIESIWFGCVPVILADYYDLPLSHLLDWTKFSIIIPESEFHTLLNRTRSAKWAVLYDNLRRVSPMFLYHRRPVFGDALYSTALVVRDRIEARSSACDENPFV